MTITLLLTATVAVVAVVAVAAAAAAAGQAAASAATSTSTAVDAYGWKTGELLHLRHTQIARAGYCLVGQSGCVGQATQFFDTDSTGAVPWDFSATRRPRSSSTWIPTILGAE